MVIILILLLSLLNLKWQEFHMEITVMPTMIVLVCTIFVERAIVWLLCCQIELALGLLKKAERLSRKD